MAKYRPHKQYLNKVHSMKLTAQGRKGNFLGRIEGIVCFVIDDQGQTLKIGDEVTVKVTGSSEKVLLSELIPEVNGNESTE